MLKRGGGGETRQLSMLFVIYRLMCCHHKIEMYRILLMCQIQGCILCLFCTNNDNADIYIASKIVKSYASTRDKLIITI